MIPLDRYLAEVLEAAPPLPPARTALEAALGLVLAEPVAATVTLPGFDNSAMDGFAVHAADVAAASAEQPVTLRVVADVAAGSSADPRVGPGECARIMTGAPVPSDADAIVPLEQTTQGTAIDAVAAATVAVTVAPKLGAHIRRAGEDVEPGDLVADAGTRLGARTVAALAAIGVVTVVVHPRVRVGVITTGDELVSPGATLERGQIYDSNGPLLSGLITEAGAELVARVRVGDGEEAFAAAFTQLRERADVVITTGGASVGAFDVARLALDGAGVRFANVAMQPGKPQGFGVVAGTLVFGLPGNPVSVFASFEAFVRPALRRLAGERGPAHLTRRLPAGASWRAPARRAQLMPVVVRDGSVVPATERGSGSHLAARLARAQALAVVPAEVDEVHDGDVLEIWEVLA